MNKDVKVEGLTMQATTTDDLEISLGDIGNGTATAAASTATISTASVDDTDLSWQRSIQISSYYSSIGKLLPASSPTGESIYYADESGIKASGKSVTDGTAVKQANASSGSYDVSKDDTHGSAKVTLQDAYTASGTLSVDTTETSEGYYVDIPMWIRSTSTASQSVKCTVVITDRDVKEGDAAESVDLTKAVRVAIIPTGSNSSSSANLTYTNSDGTVNDNDGVGTARVFGIDSLYYHNNATESTFGSPITTAVLGSTSNYSASSLSSTTIYKAESTTQTGVTENKQTIFTVPATTQGKYGVVSFVARVWIEGESQSCWDASADQNWNIDFYFSATEESE